MSKGVEMGRRLLLLAVVALLVLPVGCASGKSKLEKRYAEGLRPFTSVGLADASLHVAWNKQLSFKEEKTEVKVRKVYLIADMLIFEADDMLLYAFDRVTGDNLWIAVLPRPLKFKPTLYENVLHGICGNDMVEIDHTGKVEIGAAFGISPSAPFIITEDDIYVPASDGGLHKLNRGSMFALWPKPARTSGVIVSRPIEMGSYIIFGTTAGRLLGIDKITGGRQINYKTRGSIPAQVAISEDSIYFGSADFHVYCVSINDTLRWSRIVEGSVTAPVTLADGRLLAAPLGIGIVALDMTDGANLWKNPDVNTVVSYDSSHIFALAPQDELHVLDAESGRTLERLDVSSYKLLPANDSGDGLGYLVTGDGTITCLKTK